jgi:hypothetical protein
MAGNYYQPGLCDLSSALQALTTGSIYINVVTNKFLNGEIRGQLRREHGDD